MSCWVFQTEIFLTIFSAKSFENWSLAVVCVYFRCRGMCVRTTLSCNEHLTKNIKCSERKKSAGMCRNMEESARCPGGSHTLVWILVARKARHRVGQVSHRFLFLWLIGDFAKLFKHCTELNLAVKCWHGWAFSKLVKCWHGWAFSKLVKCWHGWEFSVSGSCGFMRAAHTLQGCPHRRRIGIHPGLSRRTATHLNGNSFAQFGTIFNSSPVWMDS